MIDIPTEALNGFKLAESTFSPTHPLHEDSSEEIECLIVKGSLLHEMFGIPSQLFVGRTSSGIYFVSEALESKYIPHVLSHEYWTANPTPTRPWAPARQRACEYEHMSVEDDMRSGKMHSNLKQYATERIHHFHNALGILYREEKPPTDPLYEQITLALDFWRRVAAGKSPHPATAVIGR